VGDLARSKVSIDIRCVRYVTRNAARVRAQMVRKRGMIMVGALRRIYQDPFAAFTLRYIETLFLPQPDSPPPQMITLMITVLSKEGHKACGQTRTKGASPLPASDTVVTCGALKSFA
jgi:hypothetical protein